MDNSNEKQEHDYIKAIAGQRVYNDELENDVSLMSMPEFNQHRYGQADDIVNFDRDQQ